MRICIDARKIEDLGIGTYVRNLLKQIHSIDRSEEYFLVFHPGDVHRYEYPEGNFHKVISPAGKYGLREHIAIPRILRRYDIDLYHSPHYVTPVWNRKPTVVTIHDLIHLIFPQFLPSIPARWYAKRMLANSVKHAARIITVSEWSKRDIVSVLGVPGEKVSVVYPAADERFTKISDGSHEEILRNRFRIDGKYVLYAGSFKPHKNVSTLIRAFGRIGPALCCCLVLVGRGWSRHRELGALAEQAGLTERLFVFEDVDQAELNALYNGADLFVFPSLYEGFGLPPLEAMRCDLPVAASNASCIPEVLGDAAVYFDPNSPSDMAEKIEALLTDEVLRRKMIGRGRERTAFFSWTETAEQTLEIYREAAEL